MGSRKPEQGKLGFVYFVLFFSFMGSVIKILFSYENKFYIIRW